MRRTPLQRSAKGLSRTASLARTPMRSRATVIRRVSEKKQREDTTYVALRRPFLEANPVCKCGRPSEVVQHKQGRGSHYLDVSTWSARCRDCERDEHAHPERSYANGDLIRRNSA